MLTKPPGPIPPQQDQGAQALDLYKALASQFKDLQSALDTTVRRLDSFNTLPAQGVRLFSGVHDAPVTRTFDAGAKPEFWVIYAESTAAATFFFSQGGGVNTALTELTESGLVLPVNSNAIEIRRVLVGAYQKLDMQATTAGSAVVSWTVAAIWGYHPQEF